MTRTYPRIDPLESVRPPRLSLWQRARGHKVFFFYLLPALLLMAVMTFYPLLYQGWMSVTDYGIHLDRQSVNPYGPNYRPAAYVGLENYERILRNDVSAKLANFNFLSTLIFNLRWTMSNVFVHVLLGIAIALVLNTEGLWFKRFYRAIYILPMVLPSLVVAVIWRNMFDEQYGAINMTLKLIGGWFGVSEELFKIRWLSQMEPPIGGSPLTLSFYALFMANVWLGWPFMSIVATSALQSIPRELYEAAMMDGAGGWQRFRTITLPLLRPTMVPATMIGIIWTFNQFNVIYFISGGGPLGQTEILVTQAFRLVNETHLYGMAAALSVYILCILGAISLVANRITRATESYDA